MFDHESSAVREGIEFLEQLLDNDFREEASLDPESLREKLDEIEADVRELVANLPYEAIDDDEEREYQHPGTFDDSEELEDEVVECDDLVDRALELLAEVEAMYFPPEDGVPAPSQSEPSPGRAAAEPTPPASSVSVVPTPKAAARMAARKAERRKEARKGWLQVLLVLAGIALALLLIAISSD